MPQLQITPVPRAPKPVFSRPEADPGFGLGQGITEFGESFKVAGEVAGAVGKSRAKAAAGKYAQDLEATAINIQKEQNSELWMEAFEVERTRLRERYADTPFMRTDTFDDRADLAEGNRRNQLQTNQNRAILADGVLAHQEVLRGWQDEFVRADTDEEAALAMTMMEIENAIAMDDGILSEAEAAETIRESRVAAIFGRSDRLERTNPEAAFDFADRMAKAGFLGAAHEAKLKQRAHDTDMAQLRDSWAIEREARERTERIKQERGDAETSALWELGQPGSPGRVTMDAIRRSPNLPRQDVIRYEALALGSGKFESRTNQPEAHRQAIGLAMGTILPMDENGDPLLDAEGNPMGAAAAIQRLSDKLTPETVGALVEDVEKRLLGPAMETLRTVIRNLGGTRGEGSEKAGLALRELSRWYIAQNGGATQESVNAKVDELFKQHDIWGDRLGQLLVWPVGVPVRKDDGVIDRTASERELLRMRTETAENDTPAGSEQYLDAEQYKLAVAELKRQADMEERTAAARVRATEGKK